jgi:hypothetical protein
MPDPGVEQMPEAVHQKLVFRRTQAFRYTQAFRQRIMASGTERSEHSDAGQPEVARWDDRT